MTVEAGRRVGRDPHDVLGVPGGADRQQVMQAFRRKVRQGGHPDTGGDTRAFEEIIRARDELLDPVNLAHDVPGRQTAPVTNPPSARPRPASSPPSTRPPSPAPPPRETSKLAIATGVLAALGPLFWPIAIIVGHIALRHIKRTGKGGGAFVPIALLVLYVLTVPILVRILTFFVVP